ncbi:MAG: virulence factor SrfC family protein [Roseomonas sp.]|nr:virulence factor SrfC family protein [Roseomonas sp.]
MSGTTHDQDAAPLVAACAATEQAAQSALAWMRDFPTRVAQQRPALEREFRMAAVQARKLRAAAERPMAVGVYGLSQAGKSYLISTLARPPGRPLTVELDTARPFAADLNPEKEKEATGLVTRFTMRREAAPPGFAARIRLLTEVDLVKILANSWFRDARDPELAGHVPPEEATATLDALAAAGGAEHGEVAQEDLWDLQTYCEREFRASDTMRMSLRGVFWDRAAALAPRLALERRCELYALLWNRFAPFTELLRRLCGRLAELRQARDAWAPIAALVPKTDTVLDVDTLGRLHDAGAPTIEVMADSGARCRLTRPELTALIAELQLTMSELPWPVLETTDLLDFPGARERKGRNHAEEIGANPALLGDYFLRGKVAYLFDRYADERELNALLLCIKESNNPYDSTIRASIRGWIARTHGETPEERARVPTSLFILLTRMDMHFNRTPGRDENAPSDDLWQARITASIVQPLSESQGWLDAWHPGEPFRNTLLARNPEKSQSLSVLAADGSEAGWLPGIPERQARWGAEFAAYPDVRRYVADPARAWAEAFRLNDAGMTYLVEKLAPVCIPDNKRQQVANQIASLRAALRRQIQVFHVSDDLDVQERERLEKLAPALDAIAGAVVDGRFGTLLSQLQLDVAEAAEVILAPVPPARPAAAPAAAGAPPRRNLDALIRGTLRQPQAAAASLSGDRSQEWGAALTAGWIAQLRRFALDPVRRGAFGLEAAEADALVAELAAIADRCNLPQRVARRLASVQGTLSFVQAAAGRAAAAAQEVNDLVAWLGLMEDGQLAPDRPSAGEGEPPVFAPTPPPPVAAFEVPAEAAPIGQRFGLDWIVALQDAVVRNVRTRGSAGMVDPRDNAAVGAVLRQLS